MTWLIEWFTNPYNRDELVNEAEEWVRNRGRRPKRVTVPDVRGLVFSEAWERLMLAGFRVTVHRLEPNPAAEDGIVVAQDPPPGTVARRKAKIRLSVLHPKKESG